MAPPEVFLPLGTSHYPKLTILPAILQQVGAVSTIFILVPFMIVAAVPIVVSLVVLFFVVFVVVSSHRRRGNQGGAQH